MFLIVQEIYVSHRQKNEFVIVFTWNFFYLREMRIDTKLTRYSMWLCTMAV